MKKSIWRGLAALLFVATSAIAQEKIVLAAEDNWYPYSAREGDHAAGRTVDIVNAAYEAAGATLMLEVVPFNRAMIKAKAGAYAGAFNSGLNEEVRRDYLVPRNYVALSEQVAITRIGEPFQDKSTFNGKRLALTLGYTYPSEITNDARNKIERASSDIINLKKIAAGHADFTIIDRLVALAIMSKEPELKKQLAIVGTLHTEKIYVVFSKTERGEEALALYDQGMDKIRRNGVLKSISDRWEAKLR